MSGRKQTELLDRDAQDESAFQRQPVAVRAGKRWSSEEEYKLLAFREMADEILSKEYLPERNVAAIKAKRRRMRLGAPKGDKASFRRYPAKPGEQSPLIQREVSFRPVKSSSLDTGEDPDRLLCKQLITRAKGMRPSLLLDLLRQLETVITRNSEVVLGKYETYRRGKYDSERRDEDLAEVVV